MKLSKREDKDRKIQSLKRHTIMVAQAFGFATLMVLSFLSLHGRGIYFNQADTPNIAIMMGVFSLPFGLVANGILSSALKKLTRLGVSIEVHDEKSFLTYRDQRLPIMLHLLLGAISIFLQTTMLLIFFKSQWSGAACAFVTGFIFAFYWITVYHLENPLTSPWIAERVPNSWLRADVDEYFELEEKKKAPLTEALGNEVAVSVPVTIH